MIYSLIWVVRDGLSLAVSMEFSCVIVELDALLVVSFVD